MDFFFFRFKLFGFADVSFGTNPVGTLSKVIQNDLFELIWIFAHFNFSNYKLINRSYSNVFERRWLTILKIIPNGDEQSFCKYVDRTAKSVLCVTVFQV